MSQELYELPDGWEWKELLDTVSTSGFKVGKIPKKDFREEGILPIIDQSQSYIAGYCESENGFEGKLPVIVYGDHTNSVKHIDFQFICGADGTKVLAPKTGVFSWFLYFAILRFRPESQGYRRHFPLLKQQKVPLPPLNEQKRIVAKLDALFTRIDTAITHLQQTLELSKALFASALDETFEINDKSGRTIEDVALLVSGQHLNKSEYTEVEMLGSIPYLTGPAEFGDIKPKPSRWTSIRRAIALSGDTLITVKGSGVGKVNMMVAPEIAISRQLMAVRSKGQLDQDYLHFFFKARQQVFADKKTGAAIPGIGRKDVLEQVIPTPPLDEQTHMVSHLEALSEQIHTLEVTTQEKINDLTALKASLLDAAFKGAL